MLKKVLFTIVFAMLATGSALAQSPASNTDTVLVLPFENTSKFAEFNWVGESFADSLATLLEDQNLNVVSEQECKKARRVPCLFVISNEERKIIQNRLRIPLTNVPSLGTSLKLAFEGKATLLVTGKYDISPAQGDKAAIVSVWAKIIRVKEGRFLAEETPEGKRISREIYLNDALQNLQTIQGQVAFQILYQRDKGLPFEQNKFVEVANKVPPRAFEAYVKALLTPATDAQTREGYLRNAIRIFSEERPNKIYLEALLELGHFYLNNQKPNEAIDYFNRISNHYQKCVEQAKEEKKLPQCNNDSYAEAAFYSGLIHWQQENYEQALAVMRPLAEDLKLVNVYNTLGAISVQASRLEKKNKGKSAALLEEGIQHLKKALDSMPEEASARFNYALALFLNLQYSEAAKELRPLIAGSPTDGESYFLLAKALEAAKDAAAADIDNQARRFLTQGDRYAKLQSEWTRARTVDAVGLRLVQPVRKDFVSVVLLKNQARPEPKPIDVTEEMLIKARGFYGEGKDDEAIEVLRRLLLSEPMNAEGYYLSGMIFSRRGDKEQAVNNLKTALFWDNRLINANIALIKIFIEKKDCQQAETYLASGREALSQLERDSAAAALVEEKKTEFEGLQRLVERCSTK